MKIGLLDLTRVHWHTRVDGIITFEFFISEPDTTEHRRSVRYDGTPSVCQIRQNTVGLSDTTAYRQSVRYDGTRSVCQIRLHIVSQSETTAYR